MFQHIFYISFFILLSFYSCIEKVDFTDIKVNDQYELTVPNYLHACTDLHKNAAIQFQSTENDIYLVAIDEKKSVIRDVGMFYNLRSYYSTILKQPFLSEIKNLTMDTFPVSAQIGKNKALIASIMGMVNHRSVFYKLAVIETPTSFYQIIVWTRADKKKQYERTMMKIVESFKEIKK
jgi:hypothetical protein